jgi:PTS system cellobiose-specific IIB component
MLVAKMQQAAKAKGITAEIWATPEADVKHYLEKGVDVILLGPQVRFLKDKLVALVQSKGIPVDVIQGMHYGLMNGEAVLQQAIELVQS